MHFDYLQIMHKGFRRSGDELFWNEGRREYKPEDLTDVLPYADEDIFPNIRQLFHCATAFSMQSCAESAYQPYADEYH